MRDNFFKIQYYVFLTVVFCFLFICLSSAGSVSMNVIKISLEEWNLLKSKKIFFGHHSVGDNIINGIMTIDKNDTKINLNIIKTLDPVSNGHRGFFAHERVGNNFNPLSKIKSFDKIIAGGLGKKLDIAFMKFCFVDIGTETDLKVVFSVYKKTLRRLKKKYPGVTFVHVTVPLVVEPTGFKSYVKQKMKEILGKNNPYENTSKEKYNRLIRTEYAGKEPIFDLAEFESTYEDGHRLLYYDDALEYEALIPEYSTDGGHLNDLGQRRIATELLKFLVSL